MLEIEYKAKKYISNEKHNAISKTIGQFLPYVTGEN